MYDNGAKGYFDAISYHPYHLDIPFSQSGIPLRGALRYYREIRALMDLNGDEELKACISEYGIPTTNIGRVVDEAYQAEFIEDLLSFWPTVNGAERPEGPVYIYDPRLPDRRPERAIQLRRLQDRLDTEGGRVHHRAVRRGSCRSARAGPGSPDHRCCHCGGPRLRRRDGARDQRRLRPVQRRCAMSLFGNSRVD